jgi:hypothetical protein
MLTRRLTGFGLLLLGVGAAASAILGPLVLGVIEFRVSDNMENQLIGGEIVSLLVVAPLAVLAGVLWLHSHRLAPMLAIAPGLYAVYTYVTFVLGPEYERYPGNNERAFPLYAVLIFLGWVTAVQAWSAFDPSRQPTLSPGLRRLVAGVLIVVGATFALLWISGILDVLDGGATPQEYAEHPSAFWLIPTIDLTFAIPLAVAAGVGLLRGARWATKLAVAMVGFMTLLVGSVAGMAAVMTARDDPSADPAVLAATTVGALALAAVYVRLLRAADHPASGAGEESSGRRSRPAGAVTA